MNKSKAVIITLIFLAGMLVASTGWTDDILPEYSSYKLPNGLKVVFVSDYRQPMINLRIVVKTGSSSDSAYLSGLAAVTGELLSSGTVNFPGEKLMSMIDSTGGSILPLIGRDVTYLFGNFLSRDLEFGLTAFADAVIRPELNETSLERQKRRYFSNFKRDEAIAAVQLDKTIYNVAYGSDGFGLPVAGNVKSIRRISIDDVREFHKKNFVPNNTILIVSGDFDKDTAKKLIKKLFSTWEKGDNISSPIVSPYLPDSLKIIILDNPNATSSEFLIGRPAAKIDSENGPALMVLNYILGYGGSVSRLYKRLISEYNLATQLKSNIEWSRYDGLLSVWVAATNENTAEAIRQTLDVMKNLRDIKVAARELEDARNFYKGIFPAQFETYYNSSFRFAEFFRCDLEPEFYSELIKMLEALEPGFLRKVARQYLEENHLTIIVYGPARELKSDLSDLGPIKIIKSFRD